MSEIGDEEASLSIEAEVSGSFTYASLQNAVPLIKRLSIRNVSGDAYERVSLTLEASPSFLRPKAWAIERRRARPFRRRSPHRRFGLPCDWRNFGCTGSSIWVLARPKPLARAGR